MTPSAHSLPHTLSGPPLTSLHNHLPILVGGGSEIRLLKAEFISTSCNSGPYGKRCHDLASNFVLQIIVSHTVMRGTNRKIIISGIAIIFPLAEGIIWIRDTLPWYLVECPGKEEKTVLGKERCGGGEYPSHVTCSSILEYRYCTEVNCSTTLDKFG